MEKIKINSTCYYNKNITNKRGQNDCSLFSIYPALGVKIFLPGIAMAALFIYIEKSVE
jgi:hypothetical protein